MQNRSIGKHAKRGLVRLQPAIAQNLLADPAFHLGGHLAFRAGGDHGGRNRRAKWTRMRAGPGSFCERGQASKVPSMATGRMAAPERAAKAVKPGRKGAAWPSRVRVPSGKITTTSPRFSRRSALFDRRQPRPLAVQRNHLEQAEQPSQRREAKERVAGDKRSCAAGSPGRQSADRDGSGGWKPRAGRRRPGRFRGPYSGCHTPIRTPTAAAA